MTDEMEVAILDTGVANIASVAAAIGRAGGKVRLVETVEDVETAQNLVFPGVGSFESAMAWLGERAMGDALRKR